MCGFVERIMASGLIGLTLTCAGAAQVAAVSAKPALASSVSIIAGNLSSGPGYSGDDGAATSAQVNRPFGVAVDKAGNMFITDNGNSVVRKVDVSGKITTVVGERDVDGKRLRGWYLHGTGIAADSSGNVFAADFYDHVVVKMDPAGKISVVAGTYQHGGYSGDYGPATKAQLFDPIGVAVDHEGNLFIADAANNVIRKVDVNGTIYTVAGNKSITKYSGDGGPAVEAGFQYPEGVAVDSKGNLFITDSYHCAIRKVDAEGKISTVAGLSPSAPGYSPQECGYKGDGGPAIRASLNLPEGIAVNDAGDLFIADSGNDVVRKVDSSGRIFTVAGEHMGPRGIWDGPEGIAIDKDGNLIIAYTRKSVIEKVKLR
jgi:sugar lactone lactonase YvrE